LKKSRKSGALTGGVAENITINGLLTLGGNIDFSSGSAKLVYTTTMLWEESSGIMAVRDQNNTGYRDLKLQNAIIADRTYINQIWPIGAAGQTGSIDTAGVLSILQDVKLAAAKKLYLDGGGDTYLQEVSGNTAALVCGGIAAMQASDTKLLARFGSLPGDPGTTDVPAGFAAVYKNTAANEIRIWVNDGGVMKKSAAFT
jgi:hypothetical protein